MQKTIARCLPFHVLFTASRVYHGPFTVCFAAFRKLLGTMHTQAITGIIPFPRKTQELGCQICTICAHDYYD